MPASSEMGTKHLNIPDECGNLRGKGGTCQDRRRHGRPGKVRARMEMVEACEAYCEDGECKASHFQYHVFSIPHYVMDDLSRWAQKFVCATTLLGESTRTRLHGTGPRNESLGGSAAYTLVNPFVEDTFVRFPTLLTGYSPRLVLGFEGRLFHRSITHTDQPIICEYMALQKNFPLP